MMDLVQKMLKCFAISYMKILMYSVLNKAIHVGLKVSGQMMSVAQVLNLVFLIVITILLEFIIAILIMNVFNCIVQQEDLNLLLDWLIIVMVYSQ